MSNSFIKFSLSYLLSLGILSTVYGELEIRRPYLDEKQLKIAQETLEKKQAKLGSSLAAERQAVTHPDPAFQGWWKMELRGNEFGFGFGSLTDDIDSYIFIDTSQYDPTNNKYVKISTLCGTQPFPGKSPHWMRVTAP